MTTTDHDTLRAALADAERERDEAREALARVEALRRELALSIAVPDEATEYERGLFEAAQMAHRDLTTALAGTDPTNAEGDDRD